MPYANIQCAITHFTGASTLSIIGAADLNTRSDGPMHTAIPRRAFLTGASALGLAACTSCGICGYACPSSLPLVEALAAARDKMEARR